MALTKFQFEAGPQGGTITAANSGASQVTVGSGTATYDSAAAVSGSFGGNFTIGGTSSQVLARFLTASTNLNYAIEVVFTHTATPGVNNMPVSVRTTSGVVLRILWTTTNQIIINSATTGQGLLTLLAAGQATPGTKYRVALQLQVGTSSTTGVVNAAIYAGNSTTALGTASSSAYDLGTTAIAGVDVGIVSTGVSSNTVYVDDVQLNDGATAFIGPAAAPSAFTAPTISTTTGTVDVAVNSATSTSGTGALAVTAATTQSGATISGYAWTVKSKPAGSTLTFSTTTAASTVATANYAYPGVYVATCTVTDSNNQTASVDCTLYVGDQVGSYVASDPTTLNGFVQYGSAGSITAALNDALATTGVQSPDNPASEVQLDVPLTPIAGTTPTTWNVAEFVSAATPTRTLIYELRTGTTASSTLVASLTPTLGTSNTAHTSAVDLSAMTTAQKRTPFIRLRVS